MIPLLLWRCPLCATNDALVHRRPLLRQETVNCRACGAQFKVLRVMGEDYRLSVIDGSQERELQETTLAEWYDRMKTSVELLPIEDASMMWAESEELFLKSGQVELLVEADDPAFLSPETAASQGKRRMHRQSAGLGRVWLTSERLVWQSPQATHDFWLIRLKSVLAIYRVALTLLYEGRLYQLRFREESLLKWLTYIALAGKRIQKICGHTILTSNY